jgi:hypothetical protein
MTTYYVATLAKYVLVHAENEADARRLGHAALCELEPAQPIRIRTVRPATADEIEFDRQHRMALAAELLDCRPLIDPVGQDQTDWTPISVPGRENADSAETPTTWFAYNRATKKNIRFETFEQASAFCFHPENRRA